MARRKTETRLQKMLRSDGALCVTFVNTAFGKRKRLESFEDLLAWVIATGDLGAEEAARLERAAAERPGLAAGAARRAKTVRARLERILVAVAGGGEPAGRDFEAFNVELGAMLGHRRLVAAGDGFRWSWTVGGGEDSGRVLWPVLLSAGELLASGDRRRLRQCPTGGCGLLFVARGGGRPRKWCGVACRDRSSSRRHYRKVIKPARERLMAGQRARLVAKQEGYSDDDGDDPPREGPS